MSKRPARCQASRSARSDIISRGPARRAASSLRVLGIMLKPWRHQCRGEKRRRHWPRRQAISCADQGSGRARRLFLHSWKLSMYRHFRYGRKAFLSTRRDYAFTKSFRRQPLPLWHTAQFLDRSTKWQYDILLRNFNYFTKPHVLYAKVFL